MEGGVWENKEEDKERKEEGEEEKGRMEGGEEEKERKNGRTGRGDQGRG